jgi:hypothetical protein
MPAPNDIRCDIPDGNYYFQFQNGDDIIHLKGNCDYFDNAEDIKKECLEEAKNKYGNHIYIIYSKVNTFN